MTGSRAKGVVQLLERAAQRNAARRLPPSPRWQRQETILTDDSVDITIVGEEAEDPTQRLERRSSLPPESAIVAPVREDLPVLPALRVAIHVGPDGTPELTLAEDGAVGAPTALLVPDSRADGLRILKLFSR